MGIDFGTLSGRAVIVDIDSGREVATAVSEYAHGVMSERFVDGRDLPADYALQHPADYMDVLCRVTREAIAQSGIDPSDVVGIGVDFTASTVLPIKRDGTPLCFLDEFASNPHAYVKLWKHHAAQCYADEINALAAAHTPDMLRRYGGVISCEWLFPKLLEILREAPEVYSAADRFIEAGDWIVSRLIGEEVRGVCTTGFKAAWDREGGYPDRDFLAALDPRLENAVSEKLSDRVLRLSETAGYLSEELAEMTGLRAGTPVAPALIDAHAALPALGITEPGKLLMIIGTSTCHILLGDREVYVPGISGCVMDGIVDGLYAYEAGQACVGDSFDWFVRNCVPHSYYAEAEALGVNIHKYLREKAKTLAPGSSGVLALDWWNGNRTPYVDGGLSGTLVGLTVTTRPEQIYRALIEATAYGTRRIIELYESSGIRIDRLYAAGGIAEKDEMLMQIYADVTGREIYLSGTSQACAYGSAVLGATIGGAYPDLKAASCAMKQIKERSYSPDPERTGAYDELYAEYTRLSEYLADRENPLMEHLKRLK